MAHAISELVPEARADDRRFLRVKSSTQAFTWNARSLPLRGSSQLEAHSPFTFTFTVSQPRVVRLVASMFA
jgi:hypothetical protein